MDYSTGYAKRPLWQWLVIYLVIGGLIYTAVYYFYFARRTTNYTSPIATSQPTGQTQINITANGFEPARLSIPAGTTVTWTNQTAATANVSSAPHPAHTDYPPLNLGDIAPGASVSLTFPTGGTYQFHNHLNPGQFGSITIQ